MKNSKKLSKMLLLAILLILSLANIVKANTANVPLPPNTPRSPEDLTGEDKILAGNALQFLNNVAKINISAYHIGVRITNEAPAVTSGKTLHFNLSSTEGIIDVITLFTNGRLFWSSILIVKGQAILNQPVPPNVLGTARDALSNLQALSPRDYLPAFQSMLNSVATPQSSKISNTNYTQQITANGNELTISWEPYANGLSGHQDDFCLKFQNGILEYYWDFLGINTVGSSNIQISEAQAIQIATERAHNFTYTQDNQIVSNFTILNSLVITNASLENRGNSTLYPFWHVMLPLDKMYPGGVTMFDVGIWADTGEIAYFTPIGFYGEPGPIPTENATSTQNPTPTEATQPAFNILIFGLPVTAATVIIAVGYLLYKRKR